LEACVQKVLAFERFYSRRLREATKAMLVTETTVLRMSVFRELMDGPCTASWLCWRLGVDPGQLSRTLSVLELEGHIIAHVSPTDRRRRDIELTRWGARVARGLEEFRAERIRQTLEELPRKQQQRLVNAMRVILEIFERDALTNLLDRAREEPVSR
jgi:DNA-binding MarR family transcriptional regulator